MVSDMNILERLPYWGELTDAEREEAARGAVLRCARENRSGGCPEHGGRSRPSD